MQFIHCCDINCHDLILIGEAYACKPGLQARFSKSKVRLTISTLKDVTFDIKVVRICQLM